MSAAPPDDPPRAAAPKKGGGRLDARVMLGALRGKMFGQRTHETAGRFELRKHLGRGAYGSVYLAYDPTLEREVAVKILRAELSGPEHRARLLREAKALARLEHPNVVTIYDVVAEADQIVIAMELIDGGTLTDWCKRNPPGTPARFEALLAIADGTARGLAAAHEAGITHRDIKPANILVGDDDRPRIADFGIARAAVPNADDSLANKPAHPTLDQAGGSDVSGELTASQAVLGTPAFMAPEQFDGLADAASDQWGLCATLWLAAFGEPAFSGKTVLARLAAVQTRATLPPSGHRGVPGWFTAILARGLEPAPADRWPSVAAVVAALETASARSKRRYLRIGLATLGVGALIGASALGVQRVRHQQRLAACDREAATIDEVWSERDRAELRASLLATGAGHAATTADRVSTLLDARVEAWREIRAQACRDTVLETWSADTLDRSRWCLDDRRAQLDAVVTQLQQADVKAVSNAVLAVTRIRDAQPCGNPVDLSQLPVPETGRVQVEAVRRELQHAAALEATGAYEAGLEVARAQLDRATAIEWPPLTALASARLGSLLARSGQFPEAQSALESAYFAAVEAGATEEAFSAANVLVFVVGTGLGRNDDARRWWEHAEAMRAQLPVDAGLREATTLSSLARLEFRDDAYARAGELHERALAARQQVLGPEHPKVATSLSDLAIVRHTMGSYAEAKDLYERALKIRQVAFGPDHPNVAASMSNLAEILRTSGSLAEATALHDQALQIRQSALGPDHIDVAASLNNAANARLDAGQYDEAARLHRRALEIRRAALGPGHTDVAASLNNLAEVHRATGANEEAVRLYEEALTVQEGALGPDHISVAQTVNNLAGVYYAKGSLERAATLHQRTLEIREAALGSDHPLVAQTLANLAAVRFDQCALEESGRLSQRARRILEAALGPEHPHVAYPLLGQARVLLAQHRSGAVALAERAMKLRDRGVSPDPLLAEAQFMLAKALEAAGGERQRAIKLATQARNAYRSADLGLDVALAQTEEWLLRAESGVQGAAPGPCDQQ